MSTIEETARAKALNARERAEQWARDIVRGSLVAPAVDHGVVLGKLEALFRAFDAKADRVEELRRELADAREDQRAANQHFHEALAERDAFKAEVERLRAELDAAKPEPVVYCKHCLFSRHMHYERDGKLVTPSCPGFEPDVPDQGKGH